MRESIYTIPLNDVFGEKKGCPVCRLFDMLEKRCMEYISGAAMMEPDIRIETNRYGFCHSHLDMLLHQKNRLSAALLLETRMDELMSVSMPPHLKKGEPSPAETCFVCREIKGAAVKLLENAVSLFARDEEFRRLFLEQEFYCMKHYFLLCRIAAEELNRKDAARFTEEFTRATREKLALLRRDVHDFSTMFDYRNSSTAKEEERIRTALTRAAEMLG